MDKSSFEYIISLDLEWFLNRNRLLYDLPPAKNSIIIDPVKGDFTFLELPEDAEWKAIKADKLELEAYGESIISKAQFVELLSESSRPIDVENLVMMQKSDSLRFEIMRLLTMIDYDSLFSIEHKSAITESRFEALKSSIYPIIRLQWISKNLLTDKVENQQLNSRVAHQIKWKGDNKALYYLFNELKAKGLIEDYNNTELARILKSCFEGLESAKDETIAAQLSRLVEPARNGQKRKIDSIVSDVLKVSKSKE